MKNVKFLFGAIALFAVTFLASCTSDSSVSVSLTQSADTVAPGEAVTFAVSVNPDAIDGGYLGDVSIVLASDNTGLFDTTLSGTSSQQFDYIYTVPADAAVGTDITLNFTATDAKTGITKTTAATIYVASGLPEIVTASDIISNYVSNSKDNDMMFILEETGVSTGGGDVTNGDLAFVYQNTYGYSVVSPNSAWIASLYSYNNITYTTADKRETKIALYSGAWADLTQETINDLDITTSTVAGGGNGLQNLNEGDIVVFETADGRKGALLVKTNAKISMYMTADFAYQATAGTAGK